VENNHPDFGLTTPSPLTDNIIQLICERSHPS
jgi:hypothetical protein